MPKFLGCLFKLFLSGLLFIFIGVLTVLARQHISVERYSGSDPPHPQFRILVGVYDEDINEAEVHAVRLVDYREHMDRYKIYGEPEENASSPFDLSNGDLERSLPITANRRAKQETLPANMPFSNAQYSMQSAQNIVRLLIPEDDKLLVLIRI